MVRIVVVYTLGITRCDAFIWSPGKWIQAFIYSTTIMRWYRVSKVRLLCGKRTHILLILLVSVSSILTFLLYNADSQSGWVKWRNLPKSVKKENTFIGHRRQTSLVNMGRYDVFEQRDRFGNIIQYNTSRAVLVFSEHSQSPVIQKLKMILEAHRILYEVIIWNRLKDNLLVLPRLINVKRFVRYSAFIFDNGEIYACMDEWNKQILQDFCLQFGIGMIILCNGDGIEQPGEVNQFETLPLWTRAGISNLEQVELNADAPLLNITKSDNVFKGRLPFREHVIFYSNDSSYQPIAYSYRFEDESITATDQNSANIVKTTQNLKKYATIIHDTGKFDGIQKVFWGASPVEFWLYRLIFLDALAVTSRGLLGRNLERYVQIDIDDIFVAQPGTRMKKDDVLELLRSQKRIGERIPGFHFNLGFSGHYFLNGTPDEDEGDREIVRQADQFWWFCHMFRHVQPHKFDSTLQLQEQMKLNKEFAKNNKIQVDHTYSVAPHHSGVYPVHEQLYDAWKSVWGVQVTSTEEYPHLHPSWHRRGFIFKNLMVLPRQTCGLFTKTLHFATYPHGRKRLEDSIHGGELFWTFVDNPVSIFMTHFGNYGSDRLAIYTFETVIAFIQKWTNLKLISLKPLDLGRKYFEIFPEDAAPIWSNPCTDWRHRKIWSASKTCDRLPKFLIVGPQKTGTTALYTFLSMHPKLRGNDRSTSSYEEVQFFNRDNYLKGLQWYMDFFPDKEKSNNFTFFEKSANYFDSTKAPQRASALLPRAKIIAILIEPGRRAYSWYQHVRSKGDPIALNHTFYDLLVGNNKTDDLRFSILRARCFSPGRYAEHLERWLMYYPADQIFILDGDVLRHDPIKALNEVQKFLGVKEYSYDNWIRFNRRKGFFCPVLEDGTLSCLGRGKGRHYPKMDKASSQYLYEYYRLPNMWLADVLDSMGKKHPKWLKRELRSI